MSRPDSSGRDSDGPPGSPEGESPELRKKIKSLESELIDQKIANRYKSRFIEQLQSERSTFIEKLTIQSRQIGQLETRLELQGSPQVERLPSGQEKPPASDEGARELGDSPPGLDDGAPESPEEGRD